MLSYKSKKLTIDNEQLTIKESPAGMIQKRHNFLYNQFQMIPTEYHNCQLSTVNCQFNKHFILFRGNQVIVHRLAAAE